MSAYPAQIMTDAMSAMPSTSREPAVERMIGNTPLLELQRVTAGLAPGIRVLAKAEWYNPGGSVKDRAALYMIRQAIAAGELGHGKRILDATSGNTGIALAMLGSMRGIGVTLLLPENASPERKAMLAAFGAEVILTPAADSTDGAQAAARDLAQRQPRRYHYINQYANTANMQAHMDTTGPEVWWQTNGRVTHFIAGLGTTGTFTGTSRYLKRMNPQIRTWTFQPDGPLHGMEGIKHLPSVHVPEIYDGKLADGNIDVATEEAYAMLKRLAAEEGLLVGVSAAAAAVAAIKLAATLSEGTVVTVFPDRADKYLSLPVWTT